MDAEILSERLAATETAVLKLDERLDEVEEGEQEEDRVAVLEARIISLEASHSECLTQLQTTQNSLAEAMARIAEAQAQEAEAEADAAEALAEALTSEQETLEPEETTDEAIVELEPETESESAAVQEKSPSWWENLFALR